MIKAKRLLMVSLFSLTAFSAGMGILCLRTFSLLSWLVLSAEIFAGIALFAVCVIGVILGYMWVFNADEDESFWTYTKDTIESFCD